MRNKNLVYILFAFAFFSCKSKPSESVTTKNSDPNEITFNEAQLKSSGVVVGNPTLQNIQTQLKVSGLVDVPPTNLVSVSFPLGGYVKSIRLLPGMEVHKGEVIATMEDQSYVQVQQDYLTAKAQLQYLSSDLERQRTLSEADASSKKNYQLILSQYKSQEIILHALAQKLKILNINPQKLSVGKITVDMPVYAPISGYVTQVNVNIGQYVTPEQVLFGLINPSDLHAAMSVFERDLPLFKPGMRGKVFLNGDSTKKYDVEVILVSKDIDSTGKGLVHCHFEGTHPKLLPGMFLNGLFEQSGGRMIAVPDDAVVRYFGKNYVFTTKDGKLFHMQEVTIGNSENGYTALQPMANIDWLNTKVAVAGAYSLIGALKNKMEDD